jgi:DNA (cytosine-5)-methyltransferase 1
MSSSAVATYATPDSSDDRLVAVDTFTGIGGITLALAPFACSALYCEWSAFQTSVLISRMKENKLDQAPIHSDIRTLKLSPSMKPDMIFGGFPCVDLSTIGLQKGITDGSHSKMFFEMVRLIDENPSITSAFFENVANILNIGLKDVIETLTARGFTLQWTVRTASEMGAPHQRKRWFLLAVRGDGLKKLAPLVDKFVAQSTCGGLDGLQLWEGNEPAARISFKPSVREDPTYDDHWAHRSQTMGNAVVPVVVRKAFIDLVTSAKDWSSYIESNEPSVKGVEYPFPHDGIVTPDKKLYALPKRVVVPVRHNVQIIAPGSLVKKAKKEKKPVVDAAAGGEAAAAPEEASTSEAVAADPSVLVVEGDANEEGETIEAEAQEELLYGRPAVKLSAYPTPRRGLSHASTLTERSIRDLPTVLTFAKQTKEYLESVNFVLPEGKGLHQVTTPSPIYLEYIMGYKAEWTRIDRSDETLPVPLTRAAIARAKAANNPGPTEAPSDEAPADST